MRFIAVVIFAQLIDAYEHSCGFENGLCPGWYQSSFDDFNWSRRSGSTWSSLTGPSSGHGGYGFYMYIETSSPRSYGDRAILSFSPPGLLIGNFSCLKFYYHMYGATINRLNVFNGNSIVFTKSGQQGNRWLYAEVNVFVQSTISFEGIRGSSFTGDIAIDDVSLANGLCTGCKHALNDSFGHLNITYNGRFSPDCIWTLGNSGISEPVAIVSIEDVQFGYCSDYIKVWDGSGSLVFTRIGCQSNYTSSTFLEIAFQNSQNVTIQVSLTNYHSYARVSHGIIKDGLGAASHLAGWNVTIENKTSNSLQLRWMDINHRLNGGIRFFVVMAKSRYGSVPVRKLFSPNITSVMIKELDPYTEYNVRVVAIDGNGSPFQSTFLQARTDEGDCGSVKNNSLRSPGYPDNYPNDMDCIYRVPIPFDKDLVIYFNYFSLESHSNCRWDYLRINDGSNHIIGTYCGYQTGKRVSVGGSIAVLTFHTDGSVRYRGFYLSFSFSPRSRVCGFENGLCPGWHQSYFDEFNWSRRSGSTSSSLTGPSTGHGGYGFYMYIETSWPRSYGDKAILLFSPPGLLTGKAFCLKFYYHMYGATINRLNVFNGNSIVFTKSGQQGNRWLYAEVTVFVKNSISFEGITGSSFTGDIAIDDVSLTDGLCRGCKYSLNDSFGHLNITYNGRFSPNCIWTLGNSGISEPVAIVSIEDVQFGYCSGYISVWDGSGRMVFTRVGCQSNYTSSKFLEIGFQNSQNITIQASLTNHQSYARVSYGIIKDGLGTASPLTGWNVTLENKTSNSLQLRWMDINHRLNGGVRFFVVILKSSYSSVPVRKIFSPNITSAQITELDPYTVYNVNVVAIDGYGSPFQSTFLSARTNEGDCGSVKNNSLRSPGYPNNYPNDMDCIYRVPIPLDKDLVIFFDYFSLERHSNCRWDYLRIRDGSNRIIGTYCGYQTGKRVSVGGTIAVLTFHTDGSARYRGFYLSFSFSPRSRVCGFENGLCPGWYQSQTDDFNWFRRSGRTPSYYTGPSSGHGGHGFYMYIETSSPRSYGDEAKLLFSPSRSAIGKLSCLKFYYHMYGATINRLNVFNGNSMVFTQSGQQGDTWLYVETTVIVHNTITFEGIRGSSYTGDIAIDDVSLMDGFCTGCKHTLNDSFGHLNITYNEKFSPDCIWTIGNPGISEPVAIVSIEEVQFGYCSGFIKVLDGNGTQVFTREGCQTNHTSHTFHEIAFKESQNITIQVALKNYQSYVRVSYCVLKNGLDAASPLPGWNFTLENETSNSLKLRWMDINHRLSGGVRFFVVIAKSSYGSFPVKKLFSADITSAQITELDPSTEYNVSVVAIDSHGSPFKTSALLARTDEGDCGAVQNNTLRSPGYPSPYPNNMECVYRVPIPFNRDLLILFNYFSLEDKSNCTGDYLWISDGSSRRVGTYCGYQTGKSVRVVGRTAVLKFVSNRVVRYHGFTLSFIFTSKGCGFENGLCPGWHQSYTDDFDWTRHSGRTSSYLTGPSSGHGGYGFYMYIETSPRSHGDKAKLLFSPPNSVIGTISCLKFYYHMYGATVNRLNVFNGYSIVFTKSGQQRNRWLYAEVTVFVQNTITFEGIRGISYTGDIAIDDVSLMDGICTGCMEALNESFGLLNITYNEKFSPGCIWALGNSGISEPVAIVSIEKVQLSFCSGYIKVLDGSGTQVFTRDGCVNNHTSSMFLEIPFRESQNVTIQVSLNNNQSYARVAFGISNDGLDAASPLAGWNVILENKTANSLQLRWMEISNRLNGGARFFIVIAKSSYISVPAKKLLSHNITSTQIIGLDPFTVYNVSVVAIDGNGSPFDSSVLQARTDESVPNSAPSALIVTSVTATSVTVRWNPLPQQYHNGHLLGYRVFFRKAANYLFSVVARSIVVHNSTYVTLHNLEPGQKYEIYVTGFTSKGDGPRSYGYFVMTACSLYVNHSLGLIDLAPSANTNPLICSWTIGNVGIANAVATFIIQRINISSCREHFKIADGTMTSKYDQRGRLHITHEQIVVVPFLSLAEINVSISLVQQGSSVKAQYVVLRSGLHSAPVLPGWNLTISNKTSLSFSVQWTNLTALLGSQVQHFIVLLKSNRNNKSNAFHKIVNGREGKTEMTGLLSSSQYTVEVFGIDKMGQPYKTLEVQARTLNAICGKRPTGSTLIVGGTVAPINSWPWQALLRTRNGGQFCGGSLIKPEWVLTATHCVEGKSPSSIQVTLGAHYLLTASVVGTEQHFDVVQIIEHENYNSPKRWSNDVALLKLSRPAVLRNGVGLVCLSDDEFQRPFNGRNCWTTGWGRLSWPGPQPKELMQVDLPLVSPQNCSSSYPAGYDQNSMICAGTSQGGTGACKGDSGGPLVCDFKGKWYLEGVTSWVTLPCALPSRHTVYADVRKLKSWIIRKMNSDLVSNCSSVINNTLKSPGYPSYYPRNKVCVYQVPIPCDKEMVIYFNYFHVEGSLINCWYDYLRITDGSNRVIGTFCGQQTGRTVLVNDTIAVLTFKTDGSVQFNGFHLLFSFFPRGAATLPPFVSPTPITTQRPTTTTSPGCGSAQNNSLRSPGYPSNYPNNMHCIYRVPIPSDQYLLVYFTYFSLESHSSCAYDYLRITDGSTYYTIGTYCGYQTGKRVRVDGRVAVLTFHSDGIIQRGGFYLSFSFSPQPRGCDFENGLCPGWYQSYTDDFDWTRLSGPTGSYMTGPSSGHGGYGFYMYIETSSPRLYGDRARLRFSPPSSTTGKLSCLKFYYHMYGATINQLNVFNGSTIAFTKSGQQGNRWQFAEVTVFVQNTITFEGIRGSSFTGDIAIDDVSLVDGFCTGCIEALNDSFGQLNITLNEKFSPDCKWIIGNAEISQPIAIVSIEKAQFSYCSGYIKVLDGSGAQVFSREGCLNNHTLDMFLEIAFQESQNITIRVSLNNNQSYVRLSYGILKDGLDAASPLTSWSVTLENKTSTSLRLRWMDINRRLSGGVRFFVVIAKSCYSSVPVRKLFSPNITTTEITGLDPHTVYNVSVVAIDEYGSPFRSTVLQAKTNGWNCGFEDGLCRGWYQSYTDDFDWTRRSGPTWPYNTGPSSGHGGYGFYMYIETWPRSYGDKAKLSFSPPNSVIGTMSCLKFYYHMYGATINRLNVLNGKSIVFTRSGQQGNKWLYAEVTVFVQNTITFEGIVGSSYTGNIAIDDVSLMDGACTVCGSVQNNTLRSPDYPGLYPSSLFCVYRVNIPRGQDLNIHFNYFNLQYHSNCTYHDYLRIASNTYNVIGTFCGQQTGTSVRVAGNYALLTFHTDPSVQKTGFELLFSYSVFPVSCNFDYGLCPGWSQSSADVFNWTRGTGSTPSTGTGPSSEHTSESGYYMYIEASSPRLEGDNAKLVLSLPGNGEFGCLSFYYHMYGENMGTLNVFIGNMKVFTESGDHGNIWIKADRTIVLGNNVIFEGIRGSGFQGDLAIDDVLVTNGSCVSSVPTTFPPTRRPATPEDCTDKLPSYVCSVFASSDTCASLYNYTLENCAKTCGFCGGCTDKLDASVCKVFASSGSCDSLYNYTSVQCAKTCGFCGGIVSTTARPKTATYTSSPTTKSSISSVSTTGLSSVPSFSTSFATSSASNSPTSSPVPLASTTNHSLVTSSAASSTTASSTSSSTTFSHTNPKSSVISQATTSGSNATNDTPNTPSSPSTYNATSKGPLEKEVKESIVLGVTGLDIGKWDQRMENSFKAEVARSATEYCKTNPAKCLASTTRSRRRRSSDMVFSPDMVHILLGYPKESPEDPEVTMIAFYLSLPPEISQGTVVSKGMLTTVVESNMQSIGRSMNSSIVSVGPLINPKNEFQTSDPEGNHTEAIVGGVVGGCFFLVVGALLAVYLRKRSNPEDSHQVVNKSTDGALEMKEGAVSFSNDMYGVSSSGNSRPSAVYENPTSFDNHAYEEIK